jgi:hypothetical protein
MKEKTSLKEVFIIFLFALGFGAMFVYGFINDPKWEEYKAWEREFSPQSTYEFSEDTFVLPTIEAVEFPSGTYILLKNVYGTQMFRLSFYSDGKEICHWDTETAHPYSFQEKGTIYISEQNCSGMREQVVSWDLSQEKASLDGEEIPVWTQTGSQYFKN